MEIPHIEVLKSIGVFEEKIKVYCEHSNPFWIF